jgi:hypothetical protein
MSQLSTGPSPWRKAGNQYDLVLASLMGFIVRTAANGLEGAETVLPAGNAYCRVAPSLAAAVRI